MDSGGFATGVEGAKAELFVLSGPDVGRSFEVLHGSTVGRAPDRAVVLRDRSISRHHAHFELAGGVWSIVDDGSTNGFIVDGSRRERAELTDLREFVIGEVLVRLRTQAPAAAAAPPPARAAPPVIAHAAAPAVAQASPPAVPLPRQETGGAAGEIEIEDEILLEDAPASSPPLARRPPAPSPPAAAPGVPRTAAA